MTAKSSLVETLRSGRTVLTAECRPPRSTDAGAVRKLAAALSPALDAVVVADNPDESRGSALACAAILTQENREAVLSLVTRDRNRIALESDVLGAASLGVTNFLCLTGDHQSKGIAPASAAVFDMDSIQLTLALKAMGESGTGFDGAKLDAAMEFLIGSAAHPYLRPLELNLIRLRKKVQAGARFLLTQAVFDMTGFTEWMDAVRAAGIDKQAAIITSVLPLPSVEKARVLQERRTYGPIPDEVIGRLEKAADPAREGIRIAAEAAARLRSHPGVRGVHILCGGCESSAVAVIKEAGLASA